MARRIERFDPKSIPPPTWAVIGPPVCDAVRRASPDTSDEAKELLSRTAGLFAWGFNQGVEPTHEAMLAPETLDRYVTTGCAHLEQGTRINYRRLLRRVGGAVLGPPLYPERAVPLGTSAPVDPYTPKEERELAAWAHGLPTARMRDGTLALLGLGLGAGLMSIEITRAQGTWLHARGGGLDLEVEGRRARRVPVVAAWEWALRHAHARCGGGYLFRPDRADRGRKIVSVFSENLRRGDAPKLSVQRLRATWLVRHLEARVPVRVLAVAAGIKPEELFRYAGALRPVSPEDADRYLRRGDS